MTRRYAREVPLDFADASIVELLACWLARKGGESPSARPGRTGVYLEVSDSEPGVFSGLLRFDRTVPRQGGDTG